MYPLNSDFQSVFLIMALYFDPCSFIVQGFYVISSNVSFVLLNGTFYLARFIIKKTHNFSIARLK